MTAVNVFLTEVIFYYKSPPSSLNHNGAYHVKYNDEKVDMLWQGFEKFFLFRLFKNAQIQGARCL